MLIIRDRLDDLKSFYAHITTQCETMRQRADVARHRAKARVPRVHASCAR